MLEIKFSGRGGQGVVIASQILAKTFFLMGKYPQCYSLFGGERRGAPVAGFLRVDEGKIFLKCEIRRPDQMIFMSPDLADDGEIRAMLKPGGLVVINDSLAAKDFRILKAFQLALVDGLAVAEEAGMGTTVNTAMLGAYCRANRDVPLSRLEEAIRDTVPTKVEANLDAARRAYEKTRLFPGEGP
jgi:2-oxoacid:acceptor oxidoreductase gamma subunit (pyruvate/2-ketoisovalerate family)